MRNVNDNIISHISQQQSPVAAVVEPIQHFVCWYANKGMDVKEGKGRETVFVHSGAEVGLKAAKGGEGALSRGRKHWQSGEYTKKSSRG